MHKLYELKDKLIDELEAYADNGKYSKEDVEAIKYMASAVDHLCNIMEEADEKYSGDMMMDGVRSYARGEADAVMQDGVTQWADTAGMDIPWQRMILLKSYVI